jgi:hypothetical protein
MRGRTAVALGAITTGALLTGVGSTVADLSDTVTAGTVTVGAGELALSVPAHASLTVTPAESHPATLVLGRSKGAAAQLQLSAVDTGAPTDCARDLRNLQVHVAMSGGPSADVGLCTLLEGSREITTFPGDGRDVTLSFTISNLGAAAAGPNRTLWSGVLRFTLAQPSGFSDVVDVPTVLSKPGNGKP